MLHPVIEDSYPLTPTQQGMLFHYLFTGNRTAYVVQVVCSLEHDLDVGAFKRAWIALVSRHAALRTAFRWEGLPEPIQEVWKDAELEVDELDWSEVPEPSQQERLEQFLATDMARGFDLEQAPLMRVTVIRLGVKVWKCVWTLHHIILDRNSYPIILTDLFQLYEALGSGEQPQLSDVRPFREHVNWLGARDWSRSEQFWSERLQGFESPNQLPSSIHTEEEQVGSGQRELRMSADETAALMRFAVENRVTANTVFVGAWALLLGHYTGDDDVVFGATRACRMSPEYDATSTVGLLINTLPFRARVPADRSVRAWLKGILEDWMRTAEHEQAPLHLVKTWAGFPQRRSLFETYVAFNATSLTEVLQAKGGDWRKRDFAVRSQASFPVGVSAYLGKELRFRIAYQSSHIDDRTAVRMLEQLCTLMNRLVTYPDRPPAEVDILSPADRLPGFTRR
jgi:hypothetical protein